jgi:general secretion pathway protein G
MMFRSKTGNTRAGNASADRLMIQDRAVRGSRGFTLVEMVVVISMVLILLAIALPMYNQSIIRAKEAKLHQNLTTINKVIQEYSLDKKKAPQALEDLVPGYLKFIPEDITGRNDTWVTEAEDSENAWDPSQTGIAGVHSGSNETSSDGSAYSTWTH